MLYKTIRKTASLATTFERINDSDLPLRTRGEVARGMIRMATSRVRKLPNPILLAGFKVVYFNEGYLKYLFREIFVEGTYSFSTDKERPFIVDAGSNIGLSILFFKTAYPKARIIGFEPEPRTFTLLKTNVETNALCDVQVHQCALGDQDGVSDFYVNSSQAGSLEMSTIKERTPSAQQITVAERKLSPFITEEVDLLKLDVEGAETKVLFELSGAGKLSMIRQMHIEYHHHINGSSDDLARVLMLLEGAGFGYQIHTSSASLRPPVPRSFQDVSLFCYRK